MARAHIGEIDIDSYFLEPLFNFSEVCWLESLFDKNIYPAIKRVWRFLWPEVSAADETCLPPVSFVLVCKGHAIVSAGRFTYPLEVSGTKFWELLLKFALAQAPQESTVFPFSCPTEAIF